MQIGGVGQPSSSLKLHYTLIKSKLHIANAPKGIAFCKLCFIAAYSSFIVLGQVCYKYSDSRSLLICQYSKLSDYLYISVIIVILSNITHREILETLKLLL